MNLKILGVQVFFGIDHLQVCSGENTDLVILRVLCLIGEGISFHLSIPPNPTGAVFFRVNGPVNSSPMVYMAGGKEFIAITASTQLLTFGLPD